MHIQGINSFNEVYDTINRVLVIKNENKKVEIISTLRIDNLKKTVPHNFPR